jgi:hypothetical protein
VAKDDFEDEQAVELDDAVEGDDSDDEDDESLDLDLDDDIAIDVIPVADADDDDDDDDADDDDEAEEETPAADEAEESLDVLLAREVGDDDGLVRLDDEPRDGLSTVTTPIGADEFTCQSCFLVKRRAQLADAKKMICFDCA